MVMAFLSPRRQDARDPAKSQIGLKKKLSGLDYGSN